MSSIAIPSLIKKVIILMVLMTICCQHNIILSVTCHIIYIYLLVVLVSLQDNEPKPVLKGRRNSLRFAKVILYLQMLSNYNKVITKSKTV